MNITDKLQLKDEVQTGLQPTEQLGEQIAKVPKTFQLEISQDYSQKVFVTEFNSNELIDLVVKSFCKFEANSATRLEIKIEKEIH